MLYTVYISRNREFIKYRTKPSQKHVIITKIFLSGEMYGDVAKHRLPVLHCTTTHSNNTTVDDVSKGTEDLSIIQYVTNVTLH
jgi:hypothetical protein